MAIVDGTTTDGLIMKSLLTKRRNCPLEETFPSRLLIIQGHPTTLFGKYLFGRRFEIYSLSQNGWDTLGSPCPVNVGVQDLVTKPR